MKETSGVTVNYYKMIESWRTERGGGGKRMIEEKKERNILTSQNLTSCGRLMSGSNHQEPGNESGVRDSE